MDCLDRWQNDFLLRNNKVLILINVDELRLLVVLLVIETDVVQILAWLHKDSILQGVGQNNLVDSPVGF